MQPCFKTSCNNLLLTLLHNDTMTYKYFWMLFSTVWVDCWRNGDITKMELAGQWRNAHKVGLGKKLRAPNSWGPHQE